MKSGFRQPNSPPPASGTGGFLVEACNHLSKQVKTVANRRNRLAVSATDHAAAPKGTVPP